MTDPPWGSVRIGLRMRKSLEDQIRSNTRASLFYCFLMIVLLSALGGAIGGSYAPDYWYYAAAGSAALGVIVGLVAWHGGSNIVLKISDARTANDLERRTLENVAEEMSIAAGIPKPEVYMIDDDSLNAFATGRGPKDGVVVFTTGLVRTLDRDELQGVMAHEIAHIRNNDIKLMTTLAIVAGLIPMISEFFLRSLWYGGRGRSSNRDNGGAALIFLVIALVLAILAPLFAKLLELAVSRQREYLADSTAAQLTRYPEGLASALNKIATAGIPLHSANRATEHMYIVNPFKPYERRIHSLFSTHPPLEQRILRLRTMAGSTTSGFSMYDSPAIEGEQSQQNRS